MAIARPAGIEVSCAPDEMNRQGAKDAQTGLGGLGVLAV
jgi:hypothetical protein